MLTAICPATAPAIAPSNASRGEVAVTAGMFQKSSSTSITVVNGINSQEGHKASDCTEPRSAENIECKKCNESKSRQQQPPRKTFIKSNSSSTVGHFAKDCPQGGGPRTCRNCG